MKFGYARVSKTEQCLEVQIQKLKAAGCDEIFMEKASGAKNDRKEALAQLNAAGLALVGGQLVPTLSAKQLELATQRATVDQMMRELQYDALQQQRAEQNSIALQRLQIAAQNAATSQERNFLLNQMRQIQLLNMTAVSPGQIINRATGFPVKLSTEQSTKLAGFDNFINNYIPTTDTLLDKVTTGGAIGRYVKLAANKPVLQQTITAEQNQLQASIATMNNALIYLQSGKQINEQEYVRLSQQLPDLTLSNAQNKERITLFKQNMESIYNRELSILGYSIAGSTIPGGMVGEISIPADEFDDYDPDGIF